jgi:hypothetical protein
MADQLHAMELEHARHTRELTLQFDAERAALRDEGAALRGAPTSPGPTSPGPTSLGPTRPAR